TPLWCGRTMYAALCRLCPSSPREPCRSSSYGSAGKVLCLPRIDPLLQCPSRVKGGKARCEQIESGLPISRRSRAANPWSRWAYSGHSQKPPGIARAPLAASREVDGWGLGEIVPRASSAGKLSLHAGPVLGATSAPYACSGFSTRNVRLGLLALFVAVYFATMLELGRLNFTPIEEVCYGTTIPSESRLSATISTPDFPCQ